MAGLRALLVVCWAGLALAEVKLDENKDTTTVSPKAASQNDPPPLKASPPADETGQTRFAPGLGLFSSKCQHCSPHLAHHCCQNHRFCCPLPNTFPGQFAGVAGFQGQVSPGGFLGGKGGSCPLVHAIQSGFNGFNGAACVAECHNDFQCPGEMKCCPAGCSTVCRTPQALALIPATIKPGSCPPISLLGFLGFRSVAPSANATSDAARNTDLRRLEQEDRKERRLNRRERQERKRSRRADRQDQEARRERRRNRLNRTFGRVIRSASVRERESRRERQRNRKHRVYGRVIRSASVRERESRRERQRNRKHRVYGRVIRSSGQDYDRSKRRRFNRHQMAKNRVVRQAEPNQRFFHGSHFCQNQCFNDYDCPAYLKCCSKGKNCNECLSPTFP